MSSRLGGQGGGAGSGRRWLHSRACYVVLTDMDEPALRERTEAVVDTWASDPAPGADVYYLIDQHATDIPSGIQESQKIMVPGWDDHTYEDAKSMTHQYLEVLDNLAAGRLAHCDWLIPVETDCYVGTRAVATFLESYDPASVSFMGTVSRANGWLYFIHGHFAVLSRTALALARRAADACDLRHEGNGYGDVALWKCIARARRTVLEMPTPHKFGEHIVDNSRDPEQNGATDEIWANMLRDVEHHRCITDVHKLTGRQIREYHAVRRYLPDPVTCEQ